MVKIDRDKCTGCGICQSVCSEGFEIVEGKAVFKNDKAICIQQAANACPRNAIIVDEIQKENNFIYENAKRDMEPTQGFGNGMGQGRGRRLGIGPRDGRGQGRGGGRRR